MGPSFSPTGKALYATPLLSPRGSAKFGLLKVELSPVRVSEVAASLPFDVVKSIVISREEDKIFVAGVRQEGNHLIPGLLELNLARGGWGRISGLERGHRTGSGSQILS